MKRPKINAALSRRVDHWNTGWLGISEEQLRTCMDRAVINNQTGVMLLATGACKAEMVCECVKRGLLNVVVIDDACRNAIQARH